jgi:hypothetical protein
MDYYFRNEGSLLRRKERSLESAGMAVVHLFHVECCGEGLEHRFGMRYCQLIELSINNDATIMLQPHKLGAY